MHVGSLLILTSFLFMAFANPILLTSQDPHVDRYFRCSCSLRFWHAFGPQAGISCLDLGQIGLLVDLECFGRDGLSKACIHADVEGPELGCTADRRCHGLFEDKF